MFVRARRRRNSRGAVAVEAALVTPILMIFVFGIIEMALLMRDDVALTSAVRVGGRTASANAGIGPGGVSEGGDCTAPCSPANAPKLAQLAANAVQRAGTALPPDVIDELWVYKANAQGYPGSAGNTAWACSSNCVRYAWVDSKQQFRYVSGTWTSSTINACANNSPDAVGIYMKATHSWLTGLFGNGVTISDHAVFAFEPLPTVICGPGQHP